MYPIWQQDSRVQHAPVSAAVVLDLKDDKHVEVVVETAGGYSIYVNNVFQSIKFTWQGNFDTPQCVEVETAGGSCNHENNVATLFQCFFYFHQQIPLEFQISGYNHTCMWVQTFY